MMFASMAKRIGAWKRYRASVRALSQLSDRELRDLGLVRPDIDEVSRRSAGFDL